MQQKVKNKRLVIEGLAHMSDRFSHTDIDLICYVSFRVSKCIRSGFEYTEVWFLL